MAGLSRPQVQAPLTDSSRSELTEPGYSTTRKKELAPAFLRQRT